MRLNRWIAVFGLGLTFTTMACGGGDGHPRFSTKGYGKSHRVKNPKGVVRPQASTKDRLLPVNGAEDVAQPVTEGIEPPVTDTEVAAPSAVHSKPRVTACDVYRYAYRTCHDKCAQQEADWYKKYKDLKPNTMQQVCVDNPGGQERCTLIDLRHEEYVMAYNCYNRCSDDFKAVAKPHDCLSQQEINDWNAIRDKKHHW